MSDSHTLEYTLAQLHLARILKPFLRSKKFIVVVTTPSDIEMNEWHKAASHLIQGSVSSECAWDESTAARDSKADTIVVAPDARRGLDSIAAGRKRTIVLISREQVETALAHPSMAIADAIIHIPTLSVSYMQRAMLSAYDRKITLDEARGLVTMTTDRRNLVTRAGRNLSTVISGLAHAENRDVAVTPPRVSCGPRLEAMHGYGQAQTWGLELARDITDYKSGAIQWSDVDSGLLLSGPPGCGKTTFAAALARTCEMSFVVGSYAAWQSKGHQGDMLKAMRKAFSDARAQAPCVLFIDEIDGFMSRNTDDNNHNAGYIRGVVNGLLEEMDGSTGRDGVVVIGACNDASIVDPALCRPGRLDRHIAIELPDGEARMAILKDHLKSDHDLDMRPFRTKTRGMSGADLERLARDARRMARREGITVEYRHVNFFLPKRVQRSAEQLRRIAVHEIGHAVVGALLGYAPLLEVFIVPDYFPAAGGQVAGGAAFRIADGIRQDKAFFADRICSGLGAMACEQLLLGSHGEGVIIDLEEATNAAAFALGSVGMGDTLASYGHRDPKALAQMRMYDPRLDARVEALLQEQLSRARELLDGRRDVVEFLVAELLSRPRYRIPGSVVYEALECAQLAQNFG